MRRCDQARVALRLNRTGTLLVMAVIVLIGLLVVALSAVSEDVIASNGLQRGDTPELQFVQAHRNGALISVALGLSQLGSVPVLAVIGVVAGGYLWLRGERLFVAIAPVGALLITGAATAVSKHLVGRPRPPLGLRLLAETDASFPSGHSGDSAALLLTAALLIATLTLHRRWARVSTVAIACALVLAIGASRVILGVHYPTDVLAGWLFGTLIALAVTTSVVVLRQRAKSSTPGAPRRPALATIRRIMLADRQTWRASMIHVG